MCEIINKDNIMKAFDKANGYGEEFGDWADYESITPVRQEFETIIRGLFDLKHKQLLSTLSPEALKILDEEIKTFHFD